MISAATLDVTRIEPKLKHPTIFKHFDELAPGESFVIYNDHDPKPLYYQLLGERGNIFSWEYLQEGPDWWQVEIAKRKNDGDEESVGAIAAKDFRKAEVFRKMGIDFCCGGNKTIKEASEKAGISEKELQAALEKTDASPLRLSQDFEKWNVDVLTDYIINTHHRYIKDNAEILNGLSEKVAQHHGINHPELPELAEKIHYFLHDLLNHAAKEERVLFPNIKQLAAKQKNAAVVLNVPPGFVSQAIHHLELDHQETGEDIKFLRKLTNNYTLPTDACNSYNYLFEKMKELENDLLQHVHLENNILFPRVLEMDVA